MSVPTPRATMCPVRLDIEVPPSSSAHQVGFSTLAPDGSAHPDRGVAPTLVVVVDPGHNAGAPSTREDSGDAFGVTDALFQGLHEACEHVGWTLKRVPVLLITGIGWYQSGSVWFHGGEGSRLRRDGAGSAEVMLSRCCPDRRGLTSAAASGGVEFAAVKRLSAGSRAVRRVTQTPPGCEHPGYRLPR